MFPDLHEISRQKEPQKVEICEEDDQVLDDEAEELSDEDWSEDDLEEEDIC